MTTREIKYNDLSALTELFSATRIERLHHAENAIYTSSGNAISFKDNNNEDDSYAILTSLSGRQMISASGVIKVEKTTSYLSGTDEETRYEFYSVDSNSKIASVHLFTVTVYGDDAVDLVLEVTDLYAKSEENSKNEEKFNQLVQIAEYALCAAPTHARTHVTSDWRETEKFFTNIRFAQESEKPTFTPEGMNTLLVTLEKSTYTFYGERDITRFINKLAQI